MSFSLSETGKTKEEVLEKITQRFDSEVVGQQPIHQKDREAALANAKAALDLLSDDDSASVHLSVNGYLSYTQVGDEQKITGVKIESYCGHNPA